MRLLENIPLAPLTTLGVGGPARYFVEAATADEVREAAQWAAHRGLPLFVLGGGSNLVVADAGFPGLVLKIGIRGITERVHGEMARFTADAGEDWDTFVAYTVSCDCAGLECLSGIPGTVGGTPVQNVGAYGQEAGETIQQVEVLDLNTLEFETFDRCRCQFSYRGSYFNTAGRGRHVILRVTYELKPGGEARIAYADLQKCFGRQTPTLAEVRDTVSRIRREKGMVLAPDDPDCRSAGSFFKNPVLSPERYAEVQQRAAARGLSIPCYPALAARHKIPAAWLVEQSGFPKGYARNTVGISSRHALAIINRGGATAADIIALKNDTQSAVREQFGIELEPEPVFVGF